MKKLVLVAALAGLFSSAAIASTYGDDKGKKEKKECKAGDAKACAGEKKESCAKGEKSCCKKKAEGSTASTTKAESEKK